MGELVKLVCICGTRQWQTEVLMRLGHASSSIFKKSTFSRQQLIWSPSVTAVVDKTGIFTWSVCGSTLLRAHTSWLSLWIKSSCYRGICTCLMTGILANRACQKKKKQVDDLYPWWLVLACSGNPDTKTRFLCVKWRVRTWHRSKVWSRILSIVRWTHKWTGWRFAG